MYRSFDGGMSFEPPIEIADAGCATALGTTTVGIARVAPVSTAYDIVRVAYTAIAGPGPSPNTNLYVVRVLTVKAERRTGSKAQVFIDTPKEFSLHVYKGSALNLNFIQPDGFEYFSSHSGLPVLPDTSVLTWTEGGSTSTGGFVGMKGSASFAVASGPPLVPLAGGDSGISDDFALAVTGKGGLKRLLYPNYDSLVTTTGPSDYH